MGFPFLRVGYSAGDTSKITVSQKRFLTNPDEDITMPESEYKYLWDVPLAIYTKSGTVNIYSTQWLSTESGTFDLKITPDFVVLNYDYTNFVRVLYEGTILDDFQRTLRNEPTSISSFSRANFVLDYCVFAENTALTGIDIEKTFDLTTFMADEVDFSVWTMFNQGMSYIRQILKFTDSKEILDDYLQDLVQNYYNAAGWDQNLSNIR